MFQDISVSRSHGFAGFTTCYSIGEDRLSGAKDKRTILVVDDDARACSITARMLQQEGFHTIEATSSLEALQKIDQHPSVTVALVDIVMPAITGFQLAKELARVAPRCRVILMTGYTAERAELPRYPLLLKPFTTGELIRQVETVLEQPKG